MAKTAKMLKPTENRLAKKRAPPSKNAAIVRTVPVNREWAKLSVSIFLLLTMMEQETFFLFCSSLKIYLFIDKKLIGLKASMRYDTF